MPPGLGPAVLSQVVLAVRRLLPGGFAVDESVQGWSARARWDERELGRRIVDEAWWIRVWGRCLF